MHRVVIDIENDAYDGADGQCLCLDVARALDNGRYKVAGLKDVRIDDAEDFLVELVDKAEAVATRARELVFHYEMPVHRDMVRRWVLFRRGELPEGQ